MVSDVAKESTIPFIINDYIDIAISLDVDGVHTGQDDISICEQRKLMGPHKIIGRTAHDFEQGFSAQQAGADYVSAGPIWPTPSKPGRDGIGFDYLEKAAKQLTIPYVAIGGVNHANIDQVMKYNPPLVGLIRDYENIPRLIKTYFSN